MVREVMVVMEHRVRVRGGRREMMVVVVRVLVVVRMMVLMRVMMVPVNEEVGRGLHALVTLAPPQETAVIEHVFSHRVQRPVVPLARVARFPGDLDETVVQRQVVPDRVLPRRELVPVIREPGHDEFADAAERELLVRRLQYRHGDQRYIAVRRFDGRPVTAAGRFVIAVAAGRRLVTAAAVIVVAAGHGIGRGLHVVVVVVVVGRIDVDVRRLGRTDAARRRGRHRGRVGLVHHRDGRPAAPQVQRADHLVQHGRVEGRLVTAAEVVDGQKHGRCCRGGCGGGVAVAATVTAVVVVLHAGGADHHTAHLT